MNVEIPAICQNPSCGAWTPSGVIFSDGNTPIIQDGGKLIIGPGGTLNIEDGANLISRCRVCGHQSFVPSGIYRNAESLLIDILRSFDKRELFKFSQALKKQFDKGKSAKNIRKGIVKKFPAKAALFTKLPKNGREALSILKLILEVVAYAASIGVAYDTFTDDEIKTQIIHKTYEYHFHSNPPSQPSIQPDNPSSKSVLPPRKRPI